MKTSSTIALLLLAGLLPLTGSAAQYQLDKAHTYVHFAVQHHGTSTNRARFNDISGQIEFDAAKKTGKVDVEVNPATVDSGSEKFNQHLLSADFFNLAKFPKIRFVSDQFIFNQDKVSAVVGRLTLLGSTHPIRLIASNFNCYHSRFADKEVCGGDFEVVLDRTQWGMDAALAAAPKEVQILIQVEAIRK